MFKHLLVPLDGSRLAEAALPVACELASKFESEITLLRVISSPVLYAEIDGHTYGRAIANLRNQERDEANSYLNSQKGSLRQQGYVVHTRTLEDLSPSAAILSVADGDDIDGIVMSTHGRGGVSRWVNGSVADKVLRQCDVPILLVRAHEQGWAIADIPAFANEVDIHTPT